MYIQEAVRSIIYDLFRIKINKALYGQATGYRILPHEFQSDVIWFQIRLEEIVLSMSLRKAVCGVS